MKSALCHLWKLEFCMVVVSCGGDKRKSPANKNDFLFSGRLKIQSQLSAQCQHSSERVVILVSLIHISEPHFTYMSIPCGLSMMYVVARDLPETHRESAVMGFWQKDQIIVVSRPKVG